jgi:hypothetical protein
MVKKNKKPARTKKVARKKTARGKKSARRTPRKQPPKKSSGRRSRGAAISYAPPELSAPAASLSGDLQGLSHAAYADSESVDELVAEGNAFEAEAVKGVQDAADEHEVVTHEAPEGDVPDEYLDEDR